MNDDFLYKFRKPPRRDFAAALYQRITNGTGGSAPMKTNSSTRARALRARALRATGLAFSLVAVIAAVLFFSPSTRAFAQSIIRQFGGYVFVQATPQPGDPAKEMAKKQMAEHPVKPSPEQEATLQAGKQQSMRQSQANKDVPANLAPDAAAASQQVGFTVLAPAYIPAGFTPAELKNVSGGWSINHENGGVSARINYENQADKSFLVVEELKYEQGQPRTVERPQIVDVTVRGQPGAWMPDTGGKSTLAWDENGITYLVVGNKLQLDEALKVAESLGK